MFCTEFKKECYSTRYGKWPILYIVFYVFTLFFILSITLAIDLLPLCMPYFFVSFEKLFYSIVNSNSKLWKTEFTLHTYLGSRTIYEVWTTQSTMNEWSSLKVSISNSLSVFPIKCFASSACALQWNNGVNLFLKMH